MTEKESFLSRWSRLKHEAASAPGTESALPADAVQAQEQELPPLDSLDFSSDFSRFLRSKAEEGVKRAALKKLFHSPHFNQMDGLDVYVDDYNAFVPLTEEMLPDLAHARDLLFGRTDVAGPDPAAGEACEAGSLPDGAIRVIARDEGGTPEPQQELPVEGGGRIVPDRA